MTISAPKRTLSALLLVLAMLWLAVATPSASAADVLVPFSYRIDATTHLKKLNQTVTVPPGTFVGSIDLNTATLTGDIALPPATLSLKLAGIVPLVTATVKIVQTKPVSGTVDLSKSPFQVVATSTFNIQITKATAGILPINLVGDHCTTSTPISVTMRGAAQPGAPASFSGPFTIPPLKTCGLTTAALNLVVPGPGNTFSANATPN
jgi:hypothetical protein